MEFPSDVVSFMTMGKLRKSVELNPSIYDQSLFRMIFV